VFLTEYETARTKLNCLGIARTSRELISIDRYRTARTELNRIARTQLN
jgi:hypothetical protein